MVAQDQKSRPVSSAPADGELAPSRAGRIAVAALMGLYVAAYLTLCLVKWRYFLYSDFDMPIYAQAAWQVCRGSLHSSILGVNLLGNHMSLLIVPIAPIYAVFPSPVTLLVLQTVVLALGALPVYGLARREIKSEFAAVCFAALYLLYPALGYTNLYEFHPETLTTTTLLCAFYFLRAGRFWWMTSFAVISLLAKEDVPLVVGAMGLYALTLKMPRRWLYAATLVGLAIAFLVLAFAIVMPRVSHGEVQLEKIYAHWGPTTGQAMVAMAKDPVRLAKEFFTTPGDPRDAAIKREYYLQMLMPVMFLALLSPLTLAIALPALAQHMLSLRATDHAVVYHYTASITPIVFAASVLGLRNLLSLVARGKGDRHPDGVKVPVTFSSLPLAVMAARTGARTVGWLLAGTAVALAVVCQALFGPLGTSRVMITSRATEDRWPGSYERALAPYMRRMIERVPAEGGVATGFRFMAHVCNRPEVYSLHHVYFGRHTISDKPYETPEGVSAALADLVVAWSNRDGAARMRQLLEKNRLVAEDSAGDMILFLRGPSPGLGASPTQAQPLWETGEATPPNRRRVDYNGQLSLLGWDDLPTAVAPGGRLPVRTYWRRTAEADRFYHTQFILIDDAGTGAFAMQRRIGYVFYPVHDWPRDAVVRDLYRLVVPLDVPRGSYRLGLRVLEDVGGRLALSLPADEALMRTGGILLLGRVTVADDGRTSRSE